MKKIFLIAAAVLLVFLSGCASTSSGTRTASQKTSGEKKITPSLICGEWKLLSLTGFKNAQETGAEFSVLANEDEKYNLNGFSGVNSFFTVLNDSPEAFPLGDKLGSTKMSGAPEDMAFEDELLKVLCNAKSWKLENGKLTVTAGKTTAVFIK